MEVATPSPLGEYYFSAPTSPSRLSQFYAAGSASPSAVPFGDDFAFDVMADDWERTAMPADQLFDGGVIKPLKPNVDSSPRRGRERIVSVQKSSSRRAVRSLSPLRNPQFPWVEEKLGQPRNTKTSSKSTNRGGSKKWKLKDFFLFRSASEGRAADKDPLKKYTAAAFRYSSFRAIEEGSGSRRKGTVSAHELHYTVNRAISEDLKRKTFLPYKQGILGRLAFNPAVNALANGFGFSRK